MKNKIRGPGEKLTIPGQNMTVPPMRILSIKLQNKLFEENAHHALVGV
jgi:hypothetical protein